MVNCMLVEASAVERRKIETLLVSMGLACTSLAREDEAMVACSDTLPDLVVMDQTMATQRLMQRMSFGEQKPVVIVYGDKPDFDSVSQSILEGASEFLMKPFDRDLLAFKLAQAGVKLH
jgi:two-component system, chemotaxis family, chemotaxis protein CheY